MTSTRVGRAGGGVDVARRWARCVCGCLQVRAAGSAGSGTWRPPLTPSVRADRSAERAACEPAPEPEPPKLWYDSTTNFAVTLPSTPPDPGRTTRELSRMRIRKWRTCTNKYEPTAELASVALVSERRQFSPDRAGWRVRSGFNITRLSQLL